MRGRPRAARRRSSLPAASRRRRGARSCAGRRPSTSSSGRNPIIACRTFSPRPAPARVVDTDFPADDKFAHLPTAPAERTRGRGVSAFLTIQEGCDKFCTFCVVPYTRGAELSRPVARIVEEAQRLAAAGVREITLIGQNVNAYHGEGPDGRICGLGGLLRRLAEIEGVARLRYTTSHPRDMDDDLIAIHRDLPAAMPSLHLPVQAGSDRILAAMNRQHTAGALPRPYRPHPGGAAGYRALLRLHRRLPGGDRCGFCTDASPRRRCRLRQRLLLQVQPAPGHPRRRRAPDRCRTRSRRSGWRGFRICWTSARGLQPRHRRPHPRRSPREAGAASGPDGGKSPYLQAVQIEGGSSIGEIVPVRIVRAGSNSLFGEAAGPARAAA